MAQKRKHALQPAQQPLSSPVLPAPARGQASNRRLEARSLEDVVRTAQLSQHRKKSISGDSEASSEHSVKLRKKAEPVKSACVQCQRRKTKCSGERPICRFCSDRDLTCSWDISDGMTRTADLKQKLVDATDRGDILTQQLNNEEGISSDLHKQLSSMTDSRDDLDTLMGVLRTGTDQVSTMMLAQLRMGASIEDLVAPFRGLASPPSSDAIRYTAAMETSTPSGADRSGAASRSQSTSPGAMQSSATSLQSFDYPQHRKDSHIPSDPWQSSSTGSQDQDSFTSMNHTAMDDRRSQPSFVNGLTTWNSYTYPDKFSNHPHGPGMNDAYQNQSSTTPYPNDFANSQRSTSVHDFQFTSL